MNIQDELKKLAEGEEECNEGVDVKSTEKVVSKKAKPKAKSKK